MPLKSPLEDLRETTLAAVGGLVGKIAYVAGLRPQAGKDYVHWGLRRTHGEEGSQRALAEAHRGLFLKLLRTPLHELRNDVAVSNANSELTPHEYVERLRQRLAELLPKDLGGGSPRHFSSVLRALSSLAGHQESSPPDANPPA